MKETSLNKFWRYIFIECPILRGAQRHPDLRFLAFLVQKEYFWGIIILQWWLIIMIFFWTNNVLFYHQAIQIDSIETQSPLALGLIRLFLAVCEFYSIVIVLYSLCILHFSGSQREFGIHQTKTSRCWERKRLYVESNGTTLSDCELYLHYIYYIDFHSQNPKQPAFQCFFLNCRIGCSESCLVRTDIICVVSVGWVEFH